MYILKWLIDSKKMFIIFLYTYIKMVNKYYQKNKEKLKKKHAKGTKISLRNKNKKDRKKMWDRYKNLSEEETEKKRQYNGDRNKSLSGEEKQKKVEYMRNSYLAHKERFFRVL